MEVRLIKKVDEVTGEVTWFAQHREKAGRWSAGVPASPFTIAVWEELERVEKLLAGVEQVLKKKLGDRP